MSETQTMSVSEEARILAEQFLAQKSITPNEEANMPEPTTAIKKNLIIGIPCYAGAVDHLTVNTLLSLSRLLDREEIPHTVIFVANESLIPRARNFLASIAAFSNDSSGKPFSHLLFIDADISFDPRWVLEMLKCELPIVALPYTRKSLNWSFIATAARHGIAAEELMGFGGAPNFGIDANQVFEVGPKPVQVRHAATGAMLIDTEVFRVLAEAFPEKRYKPNLTYQPSLEFHWDFFPVRVRKGVYLSEDFAFCEDAADRGFPTFILPQCKTFHAGSAVYPMDLSKVTAVAAAVVREQSQTNAAQCCWPTQ
jgi:hypothetical protein